MIIWLTIFVIKKRLNIFYFEKISIFMLSVRNLIENNDLYFSLAILLHPERSNLKNAYFIVLIFQVLYGT